jgi:hypothetical protein
MCLRFVGAPAWGQAGSFGGGNVRRTEQEMAGNIEGSVEAALQMGRQRSRRMRKPNTVVIGLEWETERPRDVRCVFVSGVSALWCR